MKTDSFDIDIVMEDVPIKCVVNGDVYSEQDANEIDDIISVFSREIRIDKTYVDFKGTKYEKTFLTEDGWNDFLKLIHKRIDKRESKKDAAVIAKTCGLIAVKYIETCISEYGYDVSEIKLSIPEKAEFKLTFAEPSGEWKRYPGKWQTWKKNT